VASRSRFLRLVLGGTLLALLASGELPAAARPERPAPMGSDPFRPGAAYRGDFPDPTIWRVGGRFYSAATTVAALNLPVMSSTDLRTWTTRPASDPSKPWLNDSMPRPARWARAQVTSGGRSWAPTWAPSVVRIGTGTFVAAYSVPRASDAKRCISLARSASPMGPYVDSSAAPQTCGPYGVIDPQLFIDRGAIWMHYKMEGAPDRLLVRRMNKYATGFAVGSRNYTLLKPRAKWEGSVVENPAMIRYRKRLFLFYSGNGYGTTAYATGYARCRTVIGPCKRAKGRLLFTGRYLAGPGGATPFVDLSRQLRLAYHAWPVGNVGYPSNESCLGTKKGCAQRRMYVAVLGVRKRGRLAVRRWF
jgi:beta-xylosidase